VFVAAEVRPVTVNRRDGDSLLRMSEREAQTRDAFLTVAAQMIAVATDDRSTLAERISAQFPWMPTLDADDQGACASDLL
jgi:hypothetical protein